MSSNSDKEISCPDVNIILVLFTSLVADGLFYLCVYCINLCIYLCSPCAVSMHANCWSPWINIYSMPRSVVIKRTPARFYYPFPWSPPPLLSLRSGGPATETPRSHMSARCVRCILRNVCAFLGVEDLAGAPPRHCWRINLGWCNVLAAHSPNAKLILMKKHGSKHIIHHILKSDVFYNL